MLKLLLSSLPPVPCYSFLSSCPTQFPTPTTTSPPTRPRRRPPPPSTPLRPCTPTLTNQNTIKVTITRKNNIFYRRGAGQKKPAPAPPKKPSSGNPGLLVCWSWSQNCKMSHPKLVKAR